MNPSLSLLLLLLSPPSLGILLLRECWGLLKLSPFVLLGVRGLIFTGTISVLVEKTPRSAGLDPRSQGLSLLHLSVSAGVIS